MRALFLQIVDWYLDLHTLAKVAWIMVVVVVLLFVVPWFFGESLVKGDPDERTRKAAATLRQLERLSDNQGYNTGPGSGKTTTVDRRRDRDEIGNDDDDNDDDDDDSGGGGDTDLQ